MTNGPIMSARRPQYWGRSSGSGRSTHACSSQIRAVACLKHLQHPGVGPGWKTLMFSTFRSCKQTLQDHKHKSIGHALPNIACMLRSSPGETTRCRTLVTCIRGTLVTLSMC